MDYINEIKKYLALEAEVLNRLNLDEVNEVMNVLESARLSDKRIYICGNGGSAAAASHYCCDFNKIVDPEEKHHYRFECLSDNVPTMMRLANDLGYEEVFREPLKNAMTKGDVFIGISGSGNSMNVVNAMDYANSVGGETIAIVGYDGGKLKKMAKHTIHVDVANMQVAEDVHMILNHVMTFILKKYSY